MGILRILWVLPKTALFNFKYLPLRQAVKLPIFVGYKTKVIVDQKRGGIVFSKDCVIKPGLIRLGISFGSFELGKNRPSFFKIEKGAKITFHGKCNIEAGFRLVASRNASISFGRNFHSNAGLLLSSAKDISLGNNVGIGWDCTLIDGDGHQIIDLATNENVNFPKPILIEDNTWLASKVNILKGVSLAPNTIVPYGSIITKSCESPFSIFGGSPNRILKANVSRDYNIKH